MYGADPATKVTNAPEGRRRRFRKGMFILPSLFTSLNIAAGYYAISQAFQGSIADPKHFDYAAIAIGFAVLFDGLDGRIARMTNTTSDFGRELDSLADVIAFGVAPAILAWIWGFRLLPEMADAEFRTKLVQVGGLVTFLFLVAGASRLARFNIQKNPQPSNPGKPGRKYFVGMPIPAAAGVIAAVVHFTNGRPLTAWWEAVIWVGLVFAAGFLMVSTWRFYSFKDIDLRHQHPFWGIILVCGLVALIWTFSQYVLFILALVYMLSGVIARLMYVLRRPSQPPPPTYKEASELR
jgi:CDP-diacylglycerol---serine O-phosphatidyltransferase